MRYAIYSLVLIFLITAPTVAQERTPPLTVLRNVDRIEFTGNTVLTDEELHQIIGIDQGQLLTTTELEEGIKAITQAYQDRGYLAIVAEDVVSEFQETGVLTIPIIEVTIAEVRFEGLQRTRDFAIRRLLETQPGVLYNIALIRRDAERLFSLNIFESINARLEQAEQLGQVIVIWQLVELERTGYITLGGSYSSRDSLVGSVIITQSNFRGRAEQLRLIASIDSIDGRFGWELYYFNPWVAERTSMALRTFNIVRYRFSEDLVNEPDTDRYFERRRGGQVLFGRSLTNTRRLVGGLRFENLNVSNLPVEFFEGDVPPEDGSVTAVSMEYATDLRDSAVYPTRGKLRRTFIEPGYVNLDDNGTNWIVKSSTEIRRFYALDHISALPGQASERRPRVIAVRLQIGTSIGDLPFFEQYFVGGMGSLRGYLEGRFWGEHMALGSIEYRHPLGRALTGIAFVDVGDAWGSPFQFQPDVDTDFGQHRNFSPRAGAGVGIRYTSEFGALGLDFAWGEEFRTHFTFGETF